MTALDRALVAPKNLTFEELAGMLASEDEGLWREIFAAAREVKAKCGKTDVMPRGLIECSNVCAKDCFYCGIRKGNAKVPRYLIPEEEVRTALTRRGGGAIRRLRSRRGRSRARRIPRITNDLSRYVADSR